MMRVGIAADHGGFALKGEVAALLRGSGYEVVDFGAQQLTPGDDYPDFIIPWPEPSLRERFSAEWRSAAAAWERPLPRTKFLAYVPGSSMMFSRRIRALRMTT